MESKITKKQQNTQSLKEIYKNAKS